MIIIIYCSSISYLFEYLLLDCNAFIFIIQMGGLLTRFAPTDQIQNIDYDNGFCCNGRFTYSWVSRCLLSLCLYWCTQILWFKFLVWDSFSLDRFIFEFNDGYVALNVFRNRESILSTFIFPHNRKCYLPIERCKSHGSDKRLIKQCVRSEHSIGHQKLLCSLIDRWFKNTRLLIFSL